MSQDKPSVIIGDDPIAIAHELLAEELVGAGLPEPWLQEVEERLGIALPAPLRRYYQALGGSDQLNRAHEQLYALADLELEEDVLTFVDENQGVVYWGLDLSDESAEDPPVVVAADGEDIWYPEELSCCQFLVFFVYLQCTMGAFSQQGNHDDLVTLLPRLGDDWPVVVCHNGLTIHRQDRALIALLDGDDFCSGAAPTEALFESLLAPLGFDVF